MVFGWLRKKPIPKVDPPAPARMPIMAVPPAHYFAEEALRSLGYLRPKAIDTVVFLMGDDLVVHPRETATGYRKGGEQISDDEKKALGIRRNAFMSRRALGDLTDKGRTRPLDAHEVTTLRATFAMSRSRKVAQANELGYDEFKVSSSLDGRCAACDALEGKIFRGADAPISRRLAANARPGDTFCRYRSISSLACRINSRALRVRVGIFEVEPVCVRTAKGSEAANQRRAPFGSFCARCLRPKSSRSPKGQPFGQARGQVSVSWSGCC